MLNVSNFFCDGSINVTTPCQKDKKKERKKKKKNFDHTHQLIYKKHEYTYIHEFSSIKAKPIKWHWWKEWVHCCISSYTIRDKAHTRKFSTSQSTTFYSAYSIKAIYLWKKAGCLFRLSCCWDLPNHRASCSALGSVRKSLMIKLVSIMFMSWPIVEKVLNIWQNFHSKFI